MPYELTWLIPTFRLSFCGRWSCAKTVRIRIAGWQFSVCHVGSLIADASSIRRICCLIVVDHIQYRNNRSTLKNEWIQRAASFSHALPLSREARAPQFTDLDTKQRTCMINTRRQRDAAKQMLLKVFSVEINTERDTHTHTHRAMKP